MEFFLHVFCLILQSLLYERRKIGLTELEKTAFLEFILRMRFRAASLGDFWWHSWIRGEKTIQARVKTLAGCFESWCAVEGTSNESEKRRLLLAEQITKAIGRLGKTYRNNIHLIRHDLDLKHLESDIKYYESLRSLGISALTDAVSSAFGEIFSYMRREPEIVERSEEGDDTEIQEGRRRPARTKGRRRIISKGKRVE